MTRAGFLLSLGLSALIAIGTLAPEAHAQSSSGEIVVAQNNDGFGNFFRNLFRDRRRQQPPQQDFDFFPQFEQEEPQPQATPRRERRNRPAAPRPQEIAAVEKAEDAKRAMVIGDFMAGALAKGLAEAYRENPNIVVIDASSGSSGLVRNDYYDWPGKLPELVAEQKPDAILVMIGGNDRQTLNTDAGAHVLGTDGWRAAYAARVGALAEVLKFTGKPILWVGLAPVESGAMSRDYSAFNGIVREQLEAKQMRFIETWNGFANEEGKYVAVGPDVRGQSVQLRASDGLNFTKAGQRKLAYFVEQELTDIFGGAVPLLAAIDPNAPAGEGAAALIGPMVPLDSLSAAGGEALSGAAAAEESGGIATAISERITGTVPEEEKPAEGAATAAEGAAATATATPSAASVPPAPAGATPAAATPATSATPDAATTAAAATPPAEPEEPSGPPLGRADNFIWPPPELAAPAPAPTPAAAPVAP
jgi:uncharacterized protein